jgi:hypothetical protein
LLLQHHLLLLLLLLLGHGEAECAWLLGLLLLLLAKEACAGLWGTAAKDRRPKASCT